MNRISMSKEQKQAEYNKKMNINEDSEEKKYSVVVRVEYAEVHDVDVPVYARSENEAMQLAYEIVAENPDEYLANNDYVEPGKVLSFVEAQYVDEG